MVRLLGHKWPLHNTRLSSTYLQDEKQGLIAIRVIFDIISSFFEISGISFVSEGDTFRGPEVVMHCTRCNLVAHETPGAWYTTLSERNVSKKWAPEEGTYLRPR